MRKKLINFTSITSRFSDKSVIQQSALGILISLFFLVCANNELWSQYAGGSGSKEDPYRIETAEQMNSIGRNREHWDKHFIQTADIDLSVYTGEQFNIIGIEANGGKTFRLPGLSTATLIKSGTSVTVHRNAVLPCFKWWIIPVS
jgi:hypothetical protein